MTSDSYPLFAPKCLLSSVDKSRWSVADMEGYFQWVMSVKQDRVGHLLAYFEVSSHDPQHALGPISYSVGQSIAEGRFGNPSDGPSNEGLAVGADIGLLMAGGLEAAADLYWEILLQPKNDISFGLPVLAGFAEGITFDPVLVGSNLVRALLRGESDRPSKVYERWLERARLDI